MFYADKLDSERNSPPLDVAAVLVECIIVSSGAEGGGVIFHWY